MEKDFILELSGVIINYAKKYYKRKILKLLAVYIPSIPTLLT